MKTDPMISLTEKEKNYPKTVSEEELFVISERLIKQNMQAYKTLAKGQIFA